MTATPVAPKRVAVVINPIKADADVARDAVIIGCRKGGFPDPCSTRPRRTTRAPR